MTTVTVRLTFLTLAIYALPLALASGTDSVRSFEFALKLFFIVNPLLLECYQLRIL